MKLSYLLLGCYSGVTRENVFADLLSTNERESEGSIKDKYHSCPMHKRSMYKCGLEGVTHAPLQRNLVNVCHIYFIHQANNHGYILMSN